jgi:hypothetical protein
MHVLRRKLTTRLLAGIIARVADDPINRIELQTRALPKLT